MWTGIAGQHALEGIFSRAVQQENLFRQMFVLS